jgi:hypothetical protein
MICKHCREFFARYRCAAAEYGECDCPKCQGYCKCPDEGDNAYNNSERSTTYGNRLHDRHRTIERF